MADLSLNFEINAQFDKLKEELFGLRNSVKQTGEQVKSDLNESMESAHVTGLQLTTTLRQVATGLRQMLSGNVSVGLLTITQAFQRLSEQSANAAPNIKKVATETAALGAVATRAGPPLAGMTGALALIGGPIGLAVIAVLVAIAANIAIVVAGANQIISTAKEVGTESQKAFDKFKAGVVAAGGTVTLLDRQLSQGLLKAMDTIKGASDRMFLELIRVAGPALLLLLQKIPELLNKIGQAAPLVGKLLTANFLLAAAAVQTLIDQIALLQRLQSGSFTEVLAALALGPLQFIKNFKQAQKEIESIGGLGTGGFTDTGGGGKGKKAAQDMTELELAMNRLRRVTEDTREAFGVSLNAIEEDFKSGADSAEVFFQRVVAEETLFVERLRQLLAEERKIILARPTLPRQKLNELEELAAREAKALNESTARIVEADRKAIEALQKAHEERDKLIDKEVEALEKRKKEWSDYADHVTQQLIKIHNQEVDNEAERERIRQAQKQRADDEIKLQTQELDPTSNINVFGVDPFGVLTKLEALKEGARGALGTLNQVVGNFGGLMTRSLLGVAAAAQQVLATFILTGKLGGAAFKSLAANVLAELVVMSAVKAIYNLAEGLFALTNPLTAWKAPLHFAAAKFYGIVAGVAGGLAVGIGAAGGLSGSGGGSVGSEFAAAGQRRPSEVRQGDGFQFVPGEGNAFQQMVSTLQDSNETNKQLLGLVVSASPGDVLIRGVTQRPEAVATGVRSSLRTDAGFIREVALATQR